MTQEELDRIMHEECAEPLRDIREVADLLHRILSRIVVSEKHDVEPPKPKEEKK